MTRPNPAWPNLAWTLALLAAFLAPPTARAQDGERSTPAPRPLQEMLAPVPGGLTEAEAARRAVEEAPEVERAEAGEEQAEHAAERVRAGWIPRVDVEASYRRLSDVDQQDLNLGGEGPGFSFPQILDNYLLRARLTLPITDWFLRVLPSHRGAEHFAEVSAREAEAERQAIAVDARIAYWSWIATRGSLAIAEDSVALLEAFREDASVRVEVGAAPRADLLQARAEFASARVRRLRAQASLDVAEARLRRLLNLRADEPIRAAEAPFGALSEAQVPPREELLRTAAEQRPEVLAIQALVRARREEVDVARGRRYPSLDLAASVDYANPNPRAVPQTDEFEATWEAGVFLTWRPTDLPAVGHEIAEARLEVTRAEKDLARLLRDLEVQITERRTDLVTALATAEAADEGVAAARESHRSRAERYAVGEATSTEVLEAENTLREAQLDLLQARIDARRAQARLDHAVGRALR